MFSSQEKLWLDSLEVRNTYFVKGDRVIYLGLNELGEKSRATISLSNFETSHNETLVGLQLSENV